MDACRVILQQQSDTLPLQGSQLQSTRGAIGALEMPTSQQADSLEWIRLTDLEDACKEALLNPTSDHATRWQAATCGDGLTTIGNDYSGGGSIYAGDGGLTRGRYGGDGHGGGGGGYGEGVESAVAKLYLANLGLSEPRRACARHADGVLPAWCAEGLPNPTPVTR